MRKFTSKHESQKALLKSGRYSKATRGVSVQPVHPPPAGTLFLSRKSSCACGGGCPACQTKSNHLKVSQPNDNAEIEADRIADQVMRMPVGGQPKVKNHQSAEPGKLHAKCSECEESEQGETVLRKEGNVSAAADPVPPDDGAPNGMGISSVKNVISSGGTRLDRESRSFFEPRFGMDLSDVRIHTGAPANESARSVNARAYTLGNNIVFGPGEYRPGDDSGRHLLAHELAHVAQQESASSNAKRRVIHRQPAPPPVPRPAPVPEPPATAPPGPEDAAPAAPSSTPQQAAPAAPPPAPSPAPDPCQVGIDETVAGANTWLRDAVGQLVQFEGEQAAIENSQATPRPALTADGVRIAGALEYNFHTRQSGYVRLLRERLQLMQSRLSTRANLTLRCSTPQDTACGVRNLAQSTVAFAEPNLVVFCNVGTTGNRPVETFVHELVHAIIPSVGTRAAIRTQDDTPRDRAYEHQRFFHLSTVEEALDNAEPYGILVRQLVQRRNTRAAVPYTDTFSNCTQTDLINSAVARAEMWNYFGQRWLEAAADFARGTTLRADDQARVTPYFNATTAAQLNTLQTFYQTIVESFRNGVNINCQVSTSRCAGGALGYARQNSVSDSAINTLGSSSPQFYMYLCPAWFSESEENRVRSIYALFILSRPNHMTTGITRANAYNYVDLGRDLHAHVMPPPRAGSLQEHQLSDLQIALQDIERRIQEMQRQLNDIQRRLEQSRREFDGMGRRLGRP